MQPTPDWSVQQAFDWGYVQAIKPSLLTQRDYQRAISYWNEKSGNPAIRQVTSAICQKFIDDMQEAGFSSNTVRCHWQRISRVISWFYPKDNNHRNSLGLLTGRPPRVTHKAIKGKRDFNPLDLTLYEAWNQFHLPDLQGDAAPRTIQGYEGALRQWESLTPNPPLREITNLTMNEFKKRLAESGLSPVTVNKQVRTIRVFLRRLGPQETRNPAGLGLLCHVPYTKRIKEPAKLPRILNQSQLSAILGACDIATWPSENGTKWKTGAARGCPTTRTGKNGTGVHPADLWRAVVIVAYNLGLSKEDLFGLRHAEINFEAGLITRVRGKTNRILRLPINEPVRDALASLWRPDTHDCIFYETKSNRQLYNQWHAIQAAAGITAPYFGFHDIRRTCATEFENLQAGAGTFMLGHSTPAVTWKHYRNPSASTKNAAAMLPQPGRASHASH